MEVREYKGVFIASGVTTEACTLRVILSTAAGETSGSGSFELPAAIVGLTDRGLVFRTEEGDELALVLRDIDHGQGVAWFLTEGCVPAGRKVA